MSNVTLTVTMTPGSSFGNLSSSNTTVATTNGSTATFAVPSSVGQIYTVTFVPNSGMTFPSSQVSFTIPANSNVTVSPNPVTPSSSSFTVTCTDNIPQNSPKATLQFPGLFLAFFVADQEQGTMPDPTLIFQPPG
jgi:hypothetical protein